MQPLFILNGTVTKGKNRGKKMGFPTANFPAAQTTPQGTYISSVGIGGKIYQAITFIGTVDTFDEKDFVCESYLFDFDQDIYGKEVSVKILKKIRDNRKFDSEEALIQAIENDKKIAKEFFEK